MGLESSVHGGGECTRLAPTHAASGAAPDKPAANRRGRRRLQPRLSPFRARKPHSRAVRLMSPFMQPPFDNACLPPWLNHVKTRGALFDGIVIFFRNRKGVPSGSRRDGIRKWQEKNASFRRNDWQKKPRKMRGQSPGRKLRQRSASTIPQMTLQVVANLPHTAGNLTP